MNSSIILHAHRNAHETANESLNKQNEKYFLLLSNFFFYSFFRLCLTEIDTKCRFVLTSVFFFKCHIAHCYLCMTTFLANDKIKQQKKNCFLEPMNIDDSLYRLQFTCKISLVYSQLIFICILVR